MINVFCVQGSTGRVLDYHGKFHYPPEVDQRVTTDDDSPLKDQVLESVLEASFYRPKSSIGMLVLYKEDVEALSKALFNSNEINELYIMSQTEVLDKETGEKSLDTQVNLPKSE